MWSRLAVLTAAVALAIVAHASAQAASDMGTVVRVDQQSSVVVLDDGRMFRVLPNTAFIVENRVTPLTALRPGQRVIVQAGEPVIYREGQYVALAPAAPVIAQAPPPVVAPPVAVAPVGVRQTIYGTVDDIDRDGKVKIKTNRDSFEARLAPDATRQVKKGDTVTIDLTITPPGSPAASPR
jgi:hypothetical protein